MTSDQQMQQMPFNLYVTLHASSLVFDKICSLHKGILNDANHFSLTIHSHSYNTELVYRCMCVSTHFILFYARFESDK